MALSNAQVSVGTTATALNTASSSWAFLTISVPSGGQTVFLGDSAVTTTNGLGVAAGATVNVRIAPGDVLYGRVAATTQTTHVLRAS